MKSQQAAAPKGMQSFLFKSDGGIAVLSVNDNAYILKPGQIHFVEDDDVNDLKASLADSHPEASLELEVETVAEALVKEPEKKSRKRKTAKQEDE